MEDSERMLQVSVLWRGNKYVVEMDSGVVLKELGDELQKLTDVKTETMRLIVPRLSDKGSRLLFPFSDEHSGLSLQDASIVEGKSIRMMGVSEDEVDKVLKDAKTDMRILGFDEEERRQRQRMSYRPHTSIKLPQGPYIFCDFRTLQIPGVELNPPPSEALKRMHMLAADPGIVAIMNKHRWRVGIMTEMAPEGHVGVSPLCILGLNKNHGEEISLRLRTDDLKGFRKYGSIKKTLLHELAHMVYSDHDEKFYALDKQLNQEAARLDWTKSRGHALSGLRHTEDYTEDYDFMESENVSQKLGGNKSDELASARASSIAAAYHRLSNTIANNVSVSGVHEEPDPDDSALRGCSETDHASSRKDQETEADTDDYSVSQNNFEPDPDDTTVGDTLKPDPDDSSVSLKAREASVLEHHSEMKILDDLVQPIKTGDEPDPDDVPESKVNNPGSENLRSFNDRMLTKTSEVQSQVYKSHKEPDPDESHVEGVLQAEPDPDDAEPNSNDALAHPGGFSAMNIDEPDPDDQGLRRIHESVSVVCRRLQKAIEMLRTEVAPAEATTVLQTLLKITRNVIDHPNEMKFKRLRKGNPIIQRNILNYKAAMEILTLIGFVEEVSDESKKLEAFLVLKRNDPGLLWLAKSSLETCIAH